MLQVFCYALSPNDGSEWRAKIQREVEHFVDMSGCSAAEAVRRVAVDCIHILINLNGYTKGARNEIFALRPAPIQVNYMGFCGTMGADFIDYIIADETVIPPDSRRFYSEHVVYMPHSYFVNDHKQSARHVLDPRQLPTRAHYGIPADKFVFANFNQIYKLDPLTFQVWCSILKRVPHSVLWLLRFPAAGERNIRLAARAFGISDDRIIFTDVANKEEHLKRGPLCDLFLDTLVCNAHTTGCDILWGGVPMITVPGTKMASRVAASLLAATGLSECVLASIAEYEECAVRLASNPRRLAQLRRSLEASRDSCFLFDTMGWVRNLEVGFTEMFNRYVSGLPPAPISIAQHLGVTPLPPLTASFCLEPPMGVVESDPTLTQTHPSFLAQRTLANFLNALPERETEPVLAEPLTVPPCDHTRAQASVSQSPSPGIHMLPMPPIPLPPPPPQAAFGGSAHPFQAAFSGSAGGRGVFPTGYPLPQSLPLHLPLLPGHTMPLSLGYAPCAPPPYPYLPRQHVAAAQCGPGQGVALSPWHFQPPRGSSRNTAQPLAGGSYGFLPAVHHLMPQQAPLATMPRFAMYPPTPLHTGHPPLPLHCPRGASMSPDGWTLLSGSSGAPTPSPSGSSLSWGNGTPSSPSSDGVRLHSTARRGGHAHSLAGGQEFGGSGSSSGSSGGVSGSCVSMSVHPPFPMHAQYQPAYGHELSPTHATGPRPLPATQTCTAGGCTTMSGAALPTGYSASAPVQSPRSSGDPCVSVGISVQQLKQLAGGLPIPLAIPGVVAHASTQPALARYVRSRKGGDYPPYTRALPPPLLPQAFVSVAPPVSVSASRVDLAGYGSHVGNASGSVPVCPPVGDVPFPPACPSRQIGNATPTGMQAATYLGSASLHSQAHGGWQQQLSGGYSVQSKLPFYSLGGVSASAVGVYPVRA